MRVLVACEFSGTVRDAFSKRGHDAWSCDLLPSETPGNHYQKDVRDVLEEPWDLVIAHPPCTYLCNSGVRWLSTDPTRESKLNSAIAFFKMFRNCAPKVCIENPIPHKHACLGDYQQLIQPWMFGHTETKATCLWLQNLPKLQETNNVKSEMLKLSKKERNRIHYMSPGPNRAKLRSKTYQGVANAMAEQWG